MEVARETKYRDLKRVVILFLILVAVAINTTAQTTGKSSAFPNLQRNINRFLTELLVNKNDKRALSFFSTRAFSNREMLNDSCTGYISDIKHATPDQIKDGVRKFLSEFTNDKTDNLLDERLTKENDADFDEENGLKNAAIYLPQGTKYRLFKSTPTLIDNVIDGKDRIPYLKEYLKGRKIAAHVGGIKFDSDGTEITAYFCFIWLRENNAWKIVHAGIYCV